MKYVCTVCGWEYDEEQGVPEKGIAPGTPWENVPEDFECPLCGVGKDMFEAEKGFAFKSVPFPSLKRRPLRQTFSFAKFCRRFQGAAASSFAKNRASFLPYGKK